MTAGKGIVHLSVAPNAGADKLCEPRHSAVGGAAGGGRGGGAQLCAHPGRRHTAAASGDATVRVLIGQAWGAAVAGCQPGGLCTWISSCLPVGAHVACGLAQEAGLYTVDAAVTLDGVTLYAQTLTVLPTDQAMLLRAGDSAVRCMLVAATLCFQRRHIWWNFVSTRKETHRAGGRRLGGPAHGPCAGRDGIPYRCPSAVSSPERF